MPRLRLVASLLLVGCLVAACSDDGLAVGASEVIGPAKEGVEGVQAIRVGENTHTEATIDYELRPPAGGAHNPAWANCGFYDQVVPDENVVHDLEHGVVWLAYAPDLPDSDLEGLRALAAANPRLIVTPYPDLGAGEAIVATAWARQLRLGAVDPARIADFVSTYVDGSQAPESGGYCIGGIGTPSG